MFVAVLIMLAASGVLQGQHDEEMKAIMCLLGMEPEELDEQECERLSDILRRPVRLNVATQSELSACGILSRYQIVSLIDYRQRNGPLMSFMELSSVDGFGEDFVSRITPFVSLEGAREDLHGRLRNEVTVRSSFRSSGGVHRYGYATRYRLKAGESLSASLALSRSLDAPDPVPDAVCGSVCVNLKKAPVKLIAGDFNARFAQGLNMWSGMYLSDFSSPSAFMRRPSGFTPSSSFTGTQTFTGAAAEVCWRRMSLSLMAASTGLKDIMAHPEKVRLVPAANLTYNGRNSQFGITHSIGFGGFDESSSVYIPSMKTSVDYSACFKGVDLFSELAYDWVSDSPAMIGGTVFPIGEELDLACMLRLSEEEYAASASGSLSAGGWMKMSGTETSVRRLSGTLSADLVLYRLPKAPGQDRSLQLKVRTQWQLVFSEFLMLTLRIYERVRSWDDKFRTDIRSDLSCTYGKWKATMRLNLLRCRSTSFLSYLEGGMKTGPATVYLRQGMFLVDDWEDRIYVYERDAPGCFNVPAFYGRGVWTSVNASLKLSRWCSLYLRGAFTSYPFKKKSKPGKAELRLQCTLDF